MIWEKENFLKHGVDYKLRAKALYLVILNRIEKIECELINDSHSSESVIVTLDEIQKLLSKEAKRCKYVTILGNGSFINNRAIDNEERLLDFIQ